MVWRAAAFLGSMALATAKECPEAMTEKAAAFLSVNISSPARASAPLHDDSFRCMMPGHFPGLINATEKFPAAIIIPAPSRMCLPVDVGTLKSAVDQALTSCNNSCQPVVLVQRGACNFDLKLNNSYAALLAALPHIAPTVLNHPPTVLIIDDNTCGPTTDNTLKYVEMNMGSLAVLIRTGFCPSATGHAMAMLNSSSHVVSLSTINRKENLGWDKAEACHGSDQCIFEMDASLGLLLFLATGTVVVGSYGSVGCVTSHLARKSMPPRLSPLVPSSFSLVHSRLVVIRIPTGFQHARETSDVRPPSGNWPVAPPAHRGGAAGRDYSAHGSVLRDLCVGGLAAHVLVPRLHSTVPSPSNKYRDRVCNNIEMTGFYHTILKLPQLDPDIYLTE